MKVLPYETLSKSPFSDTLTFSNFLRLKFLSLASFQRSTLTLTELQLATLTFVNSQTASVLRMEPRCQPYKKLFFSFVTDAAKQKARAFVLF